MGLEAFEAKDAALFFGRRAETQALVDRLKTTNLVLVTGDSGSGKSSLVKAGLIPAFREGALADPPGRRPESGQWHVVEMRPGTDPFEGLVEGVGKAASVAGKSLADQGTLNDWVRTRDPDRIRDALRQSGPPGASLLLVVDQFEELWTLTTDDTKRRDFLAALLALVPEGDLARRIVGTMRRDYYHLHTDDERLRDRLAANGSAGRFLLGAMAPESLRDIVEKPLLLAGESETRAAALADEVVKDVAGEPGNLALVEMALHESWERRHESGGDLALAYQRLGRLEGALARAAEEVFWIPTNDPKKLTEPERPGAEGLFMRLVRAGDAGGATRRPVPFAELAEPARTVARKLATPECRRLLVVREPDGGSGGEDLITVELAHEQLVTQWPDYRFWLRGTRSSRHEPDTTRAADKRSFDRLIDAAQSWSVRGRREEDLARGGELAEFKWLHSASTRSSWLSSLDREFVDQSIAESEMDAKKRRQQVETLGKLARTRRQQTLGALAAALILLLVAGVATWQWKIAAAAKAETSAQLDEAKRIDLRRLANLSLQATKSGDAITGILLALHALPRSIDRPDRPLLSELWAPLRAALAEQRELLDLQHDGPVTSAAYSPDGKHVATASNDGTTRVWDVDDGRNPIIFGDGEDPINSVAFSPDGTYVVTASGVLLGKDHMVRVWRADGTGKPITFPHEDYINSAAFSPDGSRVVTASVDGTARIWRANGRGKPIVLSGHEDVVASAAFSPDGTRVVTASIDDTARVWRVDGRGKPIVLSGHEDVVASAAFSPDGTRVVTASIDDTARVWRVDGRGKPIVLSGHEGGVTSAAFSPDGTHIATVSKDHTARLWRADGSGVPIVLRGHEDDINSAAFSPDGSYVVTASDDQTARIWRADGTGEFIVLRGHEDSINSAVFSPDGSYIVTASDDKTARAWRTDGTGEPVVLRGPKSRLLSATFSPDGSHVIAASLVGETGVWRADGTGEPMILRGHKGIATSAAFSPDGSHVVTTSWGKSARLWRVDGSGELIVLRGHEHLVNSVAFSPDGSYVVTASNDKTARVWRADGTGEPVVLRGHEDTINSAVFSPDGSRVVTVSHDGTARVWLADGTGEPIILRGHTPATFSPDGKRILTSLDTTALVWPLVATLKDLAADARSLTLPRRLTEIQKKQYFIVDHW